LSADRFDDRLDRICQLFTCVKKIFEMSNSDTLEIQMEPEAEKEVGK
jgi:hypothetical protein